MTIRSATVPAKCPSLYCRLRSWTFACPQSDVKAAMGPPGASANMEALVGAIAAAQRAHTSQGPLKWHEVLTPHPGCLRPINAPDASGGSRSGPDARWPPPLRQELWGDADGLEPPPRCGYLGVATSARPLTRSRRNRPVRRDTNHRQVPPHRLIPGKTDTGEG